MLSSLIDSLKTVEDVREFNGKEYPLWAILICSVLAIQSSMTTYKGISLFIQKHFSKLKDFFHLKCRHAPSRSGIWSILVKVNPDDLERAFREYYGKLSQKFGKEKLDLLVTYVAKDDLTEEEQQAIELLTAPTDPLKHLCVDGKTLRGSKSDEKKERAIRMFNVFDKISHLVIAHMALSNEKDNEIAAFQKLLQELDLKDVIITADAMQCQKKTLS